jgi:hypothetical protein
MPTKKDLIMEKALSLLDATPSGIRYTDLVSRIQSAFPDFADGTIRGSVWDLDKRLPEAVYKPVPGLFILTRFRSDAAPTASELSEQISRVGSIKESEFYQPFADYIVNELNVCTKAIPLGGNKFGGKWGTPDIIGVFKASEGDYLKMPLEVTVAEVKIDTNQLITAFGQVCAYKLFAHRAYLVIPQSSNPEDRSRLFELCNIFGIGLVLFDASQPSKPDFDVRVPARRHEPNTFYTNQNVKPVAKLLDL